MLRYPIKDILLILVIGGALVGIYTYANAINPEKASRINRGFGPDWECMKQVVSDVCFKRPDSSIPERDEEASEPASQ